MAELPKQPAPEKNPLEGEANDRLREARRWKELWVLDFKECYFFASPNRQRQISSQSQPATQRLLDAAELQTSTAFLLCQDFVTEIVNTYMPPEQEWCERGRGMFVPQAVFDKVKDQIAKDDKIIFEAMKASNLYAEVQKAFYPDLAIGTCAMWIDRPRGHRAVNTQAIPLRELEINLGPYGEIDDRFVIRYTRNCYVKSILAGMPLPKEVTDTLEAKPDGKTEIRWGYWRLWDRDDDEVWQHVVLVKDKIVNSAVMKGEGCCPLIVGRFNPSADWPWGLGPLIEGLPDLRQIDELEGQKIENVELHLTPPITYPDDSFAAVEQGLESGMAYPIRPGSEGAIKAIYTPGAPDAAIYQHEEMEKRLRKLFYVDFPEQTGDTPPTASQWLDEIARAQRRIGTPGMPFWREIPANIFLRFKYLLEAAGTIMPITVDGKTISLQPYNPAQRAAEQQEIAMAVRWISIMGSAFPEEFKAYVDGHETMQNFVEKMRVTLIKFRNKDAVAGAIKDVIAPLIKQHFSPQGNPAQAAGSP